MVSKHVFCTSSCLTHTRSITQQPPAATELRMQTDSYWKKTLDLERL